MSDITTITKCVYSYSSFTLHMLSGYFWSQRVKHDFLLSRFGDKMETGYHTFYSHMASRGHEYEFLRIQRDTQG
jgi:hypothetical protein